ncbi:ammonium transporter [Trichothermofontia sp.]
MMPANSNPAHSHLPLSQEQSAAARRLSQRRSSRHLQWLSVGCVGLLLFFWNLAALAEQTPPSGDTAAMLTELRVAIDTLWVMLAGMLVIFMNAGFAMLETGFCRQKNAVNVLAKNLIVFALSTIAFWVCGFGLMFSDSNGLLGSGGFFLAGADNSPATGDAYEGIFTSLDWAGVPLFAKFFFQLAFAGTAATIVSGAVAERIKFKVFLIFSLLLVALAYPITGHWVWGGGWLAGLGFYDFAGSTVVHSVGGWAALVGALALGPRLGKYRENGQPNALPAHNMAISTLGCLILWLGWFGFNPGSTMAVSWHIAHIAVTTNTAAAFGGVAATLTAWVVFGSPDLSMIINGILAGLVAITAACAFVPIWAAALIGTIAGVLVVFSVLFFEKRQIDDPVGAVSVHMVNGVWGTIAVGLFAVGPGTTVGTDALYAAGEGPLAGLLMGGGLEQLGIQLLGVVAVALTITAISAAFWMLLKFTVGIRVSTEEELQGLDLYEHGIEAYSGFLKEPDTLTTGAQK